MLRVLRFRRKSEIIQRVSPIDLNHALYGNFIGLQYVFETALDARVLQEAITELLKQLPALAGRYDARRGAVIDYGEPPALVRQSTDNDLSRLSRIGAPRPKDRRFHLREPSRRRVLSGRAPLCTFTLTSGTNGACVFGMAVSHMLMDAAGFHKTIKRLAHIYSAITAGAPLPGGRLFTALPEFEFGTPRTKAETLNALKAQGAPKPIPLKGPLGGFVKSMIIKAMEKIAKNSPVAIHFTPEDIAQLKAAALNQSGEPWISTNAALCAHFARIIAQLSYGDKPKTTIQLGHLIDLRGRYFEDSEDAQRRFIGNAILIHIDRSEFSGGLQNTSLGKLAAYYTSRTARTDAKNVRARLNLLADCLRHGYSNPELEIKTPIIALNNQSKLKAYDIDFAGAAPQRIIPQDVGDNIMFFPAAHGGIEIYIRDIVNPHRQKQLLTPKWQARIFDFS